MFSRSNINPKQRTYINLYRDECSVEEEPVRIDLDYSIKNIGVKCFNPSPLCTLLPTLPLFTAINNLVVSVDVMSCMKSKNLSTVVLLL